MNSSKGFRTKNPQGCIWSKAGGTAIQRALDAKAQESADGAKMRVGTDAIIAKNLSMSKQTAYLKKAKFRWINGFLRFI